MPARQLARAAMLQGRATPGMAGMVAGMLGMGGVDVPSVMGRGPAPAPATAGAPERYETRFLVCVSSFFRYLPF